MKNKYLYITFIAIGFLFITSGSISLVFGSLFDKNNLIYLGLTLLIIGFVLYVIVLIVIIIYFVRKKR